LARQYHTPVQYGIDERNRDISRHHGHFTLVPYKATNENKASTTPLNLMGCDASMAERNRVERERERERIA
jgi:hypothetical protein